MITAPALINLIISLLVLLLLFWIVWFVLEKMPLPEPFGQIVKVVLTVIAALVVIKLLLQLVGIGIGPTFIGG